MNEMKCKNCKFFKRLYVPPLRAFEKIPKDGFVCEALSFEGEVMWLGTNNAENEHCEMYSKGDDK